MTIVREPTEEVATRVTEHVALARLIGREPVFAATVAKIPIVARAPSPVLISRRDRHGQGAVRPRGASPEPAAATSRSFPSTAARFPTSSSRTSCSATSAARSPTRTATQRGLVGDGRRRHAVPRRDRFADARRAGQAAAPPPGGHLQAARRRPVPRAPTSASSRPPIVDLQAPRAAKKFRSDLYFRLNVLRLVMPPLRERRGDIAISREHFVRMLCDEAGIPRKSLAPAAIDRLSRAGWPGNVRELFNVLQQAVVFAEGTIDSVEPLWRSRRCPTSRGRPRRTGPRLPRGARARARGVRAHLCREPPAQARRQRHALGARSAEGSPGIRPADEALPDRPGRILSLPPRVGRCDPTLRPADPTRTRANRTPSRSGRASHGIAASHGATRTSRPSYHKNARNQRDAPIALRWFAACSCHGTQVMPWTIRRRPACTGQRDSAALRRPSCERRQSGRHRRMAVTGGSGAAPRRRDASGVALARKARDLQRHRDTIAAPPLVPVECRRLREAERLLRARPAPGTRTQ